jgi:hypothetical protein
MSLSRLTADERATYLLGLAARRQLERAPRDPDTQTEIAALLLWIKHWLTPDEVWHITEVTGFLLGEEMFEEHFKRDKPPRKSAWAKPSRPRKTTSDDPDDIPF